MSYITIKFVWIAVVNQLKEDQTDKIIMTGISKRMFGEFAS